MRTFLLAMVVVCCLPGCKKGGNVAPGLFGKWELRRMYGGFAYRDSTYKPGNGTYYLLNSDSTYKYFYLNNLAVQGHFHYMKNGYQGGGDVKYDAITFDNLIIGEMIVVKGTKLTLGNTWSDGIANDYVKVAGQ
ncbi:MAG: hypothetical protein ACXVB0_20355 [Mucilaginibacter sp.]